MILGGASGVSRGAQRGAQIALDLSMSRTCYRQRMVAVPCCLPSLHSYNCCLMAGHLLYELFFWSEVDSPTEEGWMRETSCSGVHIEVPCCEVGRVQGDGCSWRILAPQQLGVSVRGGAEAAVHAMRLYLEDLAPDKAVLKLDFRKPSTPSTVTRC